MAVIEVEVYDLFVMWEPGDDPANPSDTNIANSNPIGTGGAFNTILFTQVAHCNKLKDSVTQNLNIGQTVGLRHSKRHLTINDFLSLYQKAAKGPDLQHVLQTFFPYHKARTVLYEIVEQTLDLDETIIQNVSKLGVSTLVLTQTVVYSLVRARAITQTFVPFSSGKMYKVDPNFIAQPKTIGGPNGSPSFY